MSSVYRKGRDGYYYYQTYVFNEETKKKDKRIFHSLGTKNKVEAIKKQKELDKNYNKKKIRKLKYQNLDRKKIFVFISISLPLLFFFLEYKSNSTENEIIDQNYVTPLKEEISSLEGITDKNLNVQSPILKNNIKPNDKINREDSIQETYKIPSYSIQRIEKMTDSYSQIKIYITLKSETKDTIQHIICKELADDYSEYQSIIICLYSNSEQGVALAKSSGQSNDLEAQRKNWLGMYTYNNVEGEYFDSNPNSYLGIN